MVEEGQNLQTLEVPQKRPSLAPRQIVLAGGVVFGLVILGLSAHLLFGQETVIVPETQVSQNQQSHSRAAR